MTTMKKAILLFGLLSLIICNDITAQNIVNNDSIKNSKADNLKTAEDYFERANIITKTKMFSLDSTTASKAADDYLMAIKLKPKFWQARRNYARQMLFFKKYDIAIEQLNEILKIVKSEDNPDLNVMRGQAFYEKGLYEKAISDYGVAENYSGDIDYILLYKAKAQWKLGQIENACINYKKSIKITPSIADQKEFITCD
jgi:tetratricopeptide (TPR) repeat protein